MRLKRAFFWVLSGLVCCVVAGYTLACKGETQNITVAGPYDRWYVASLQVLFYAGCGLILWGFGMGIAPLYRFLARVGVRLSTFLAQRKTRRAR